MLSLNLIEGRLIRVNGREESCGKSPRSSWSMIMALLSHRETVTSWIDRIGGKLRKQLSDFDHSRVPDGLRRSESVHMLGAKGVCKALKFTVLFDDCQMWQYLCTPMRFILYLPKKEYPLLINYADLGIYASSLQCYRSNT